MNISPRVPSRVFVVVFLLALTLGSMTGAGHAQAQAQAQPQGARRADSGATVQSDRNVYSAGGQVRPSAPVQGDFVAAGGRIVIDQAVGGDATLVGGSVDVRAPVGDDLRIAAGDVSVESNVGGELLASGGNVTLARAAAVTRSARLYGGSITVDGRIDGGLKGGAEKFTINGEVRGDVDVAARQVELGPTAKIGGALHYSSGTELKRAEGAVVGGAISRAEPDQTGPGKPHGASGGWDRAQRHAGGWAATVLSFLSLLACGAVLLLVAPTFSAQAPERIRSTPWVSLGVGFAAVFATPVLAVLLFITLLGIPLGIVVMALYPLLLLAGFVIGTLFIARLIPGALHQETPPTFARAVGYFGLALLGVLLLAKVPFGGGMLLALVTFAGIGACAVEIHARRKASTPPPAPPRISPPVVVGR